MRSEEETLAVLACEWQKRPRGAPSFFDLAPSVRSVRREAGSLVVEYDAAAGAAVEALVAAERLCCPEIEWHLELLPTPRLRIIALPAQLEILEQTVAG